MVQLWLDVAWGGHAAATGWGVWGVLWLAKISGEPAKGL